MGLSRLSLSLLEWSIRKRLHTRTHHRHSELITCYFLNLFISYQPVTCCLNASSSRGCQSFLSAKRNQISIVSIFSLPLSSSHKGGVGRGDIRVRVPYRAMWPRAMWPRTAACSRGSPRIPGRQVEVGLVINFQVISIGFACSLTSHHLFSVVSTLGFYFHFPESCYVFAFSP